MVGQQPIGFMHFLGNQPLVTFWFMSYPRPGETTSLTFLLTFYKSSPTTKAKAQGNMRWNSKLLYYESEYMLILWVRKEPCHFSRNLTQFPRITKLHWSLEIVFKIWMTFPVFPQVRNPEPKGFNQTAVSHKGSGYNNEESLYYTMIRRRRQASLLSFHIILN